LTLYFKKYDLDDEDDDSDDNEDENFDDERWEYWDINGEDQIFEKNE